VFTSTEPSGISDSRRRSSIRCVSGMSGACRLTMSLVLISSSSGRSAAPRAAASVASTYGSYSVTEKSRGRSSSSRRRPTREASMIPSRLPRLPILQQSPDGGNTCSVRKRSRSPKASLPDSRIAASVYSATGSALARTALDTVTPRSQTVGASRLRTLPAVCSTARSRGAADRACSSTRGHPQPVISTSASASGPATAVSAKSRTTSAGSSRASDVSRAISRGGKSAGRCTGSMANTARGSCDVGMGRRLWEKSGRSGTDERCSNRIPRQGR
jgi:hypothetical protein